MKPQIVLLHIQKKAPKVSSVIRMCVDGTTASVKHVRSLYKSGILTCIQVFYICVCSPQKGRRITIKQKQPRIHTMNSDLRKNITTVPLA